MAEAQMLLLLLLLLLTWQMPAWTRRAAAWRCGSSCRRRLPLQRCSWR